jgi:hypothetical protein
MKWNSSYGLVATAAFVFGIAVDRVVFSPNTEKVAAEDALVENRANRDSSGGGSKRREMASQSGLSESDRQSGEEDDDGDSDSLRQAMESLERGGQMDAQTANRLLEMAPVGRERRGILEHLAHVWGRRDGQAAVEWAESLEGADRRRALESALYGWSEEDPASAAKYVTELPTSEQNLNLVHEIASSWAERDRAAAMEWGASQTDPAKRERAMGGVVSSWSDTDPAAAANFASAIENPFVKRQILELAARRWANQDTAAAMAWAQELPGADRQRATESILRGVAEYTPERAAAIYEELTAALPLESRTAHEYRRMAQEIASVWSSTSPQDAADWAMGLPESGEVRRAAVGEIAERWLRIDSMAAGEWILELPKGKVRDAAAERVVGSVLPTDPSLAFDWANSLSDEGHRAGLMREVLHRWSNTDRASAHAALDSANVSPDQRRELNEVFGVREAPVPIPAEPVGEESK